MKKYEHLKLENQICFSLYVCSKEIINRYKPFLDEIDLTYTQYITMLVLWEVGCITVSELGRKLYLDSGTLTPLLKKLEQKSYITRTRSKIDERVLEVVLTEKGTNLKQKASEIPSKIANCVHLSSEDAISLYVLLNRMLESFSK